MTPEALEAKQNYDREYRKKNRQKLNRQQREWRARNPDKVEEYKQRYWGKKAKAKTEPERNDKKPVKKAPRLISLGSYGITAERYKELRAVCQSGEHSDIVRSAAYTANPEIAEYILLSVLEDVSYDSFSMPKYEEMLGGIYICRTDFYGYRRLFYHHLDQLLKKE